ALMRGGGSAAFTMPAPPMQNAPNTEADMRIVRSGLAAAGLAAIAVAWHSGAAAQQKPAAEKSNMELVGYNDLQGRSAYQPLVHRQGDRWIAYIGHHGGSTLNAVTGQT